MSSPIVFLYPPISNKTFLSKAPKAPEIMESALDLAKDAFNIKPS